MSDLRKQFFSELLKIAKKDKKIICLTADLGYSFKEQFEKKLSKQIINVGIAEQNMITMAAGMAIAGFKPYCYSGLIFLLMRAYEQIRDDICYNNLDVKLIGTGANGFLGFTHNLGKKENEEDLLKNLPNLKRFYPKNNKELIKALKSKGCAYIRI
jgi:transketolase